jgi:uncharacterized membrane protein
MNRWLSGYRLASLLLVLGNLLFVAAVYHWLPDPYPVRLDADGVAQSLAPKSFRPFLGPLINTLALLGMFVLPRVSPKRFRVDGFRRVFDLLYFVSISASVCVSVLAVLRALGVVVPIAMTHIPVSISIIILGNYLGKTTKNFWLGIRTPWTLASDEVWLKTHRLAAILFMAAGVMHLAMSLIGASGLIAVAGVLLAALIAVIASYVFYRRLEHVAEH